MPTRKRKIIHPMSHDNRWNREPAPPPPMFLGKKERDLAKQLNDELLERVIGQQILYFAIDDNITDYHSLYGEAIQKNFLPPIQVHAMVTWEGQNTQTERYGVDKRSSIIVNFHKRRLTEDQNLYVREGDFVKYGEFYYEIVTLNEPRQLFGQVEHKFEISAKCIKARKGLFNV